MEYNRWPWRVVMCACPVDDGRPRKSDVESIIHDIVELAASLPRTASRRFPIGIFNVLVCIMRTCHCVRNRLVPPFSDRLARKTESRSLFGNRMVKVSLITSL